MTVKGGANGDYHNVVLAPASVQEAVNMVMEAFDIADQYLLPVIILADGLIGQMMEPVSLDVAEVTPVEKPWALTGTKKEATSKTWLSNPMNVKHGTMITSRYMMRL